MAKVLTTDMFLTFFVTLGVYLYLIFQKGKIKRNVFSILFGITLGLSILTKGQVGIIYFIMIFGAMFLFKKDSANPKVFLSPILWAVTLLISGWWFLAVGIKHEGLLHYLFFREAVEASYSSKRFHPGPFYYYIPVLIGGLFPFWLLFPSIKKFSTNEKLKSLIGYTIFPFFLFSLFPAKLPTYLLPSTPGWAFLFGEKIEDRRKTLKIVSLGLSIFLFLLSLFVFFYGEKYIGLKTYDVAFIFFIGFIFSLFAFFFSFKKSEEVILATIFVSVLFSFLSFPTLVNKNMEKFKIAKETALSIKENIKEGDEVLELRTTVFSIPFYLQRKVYAFENNFFRKKFLKDKPEHILQTEEELKQFFEKTSNLWVIVDKKSELYLKENFPSFTLFRRGERYIVYISPQIKKRLGSTQPLE
jgi:4-amino-4-deoxy-L-arabinose transferase